MSGFLGNDKASVMCIVAIIIMCMHRDSAFVSHPHILCHYNDNGGHFHVCILYSILHVLSLNLVGLIGMILENCGGRYACMLHYITNVQCNMHNYHGFARNFEE